MYRYILFEYLESILRIVVQIFEKINEFLFIHSFMSIMIFISWIKIRYMDHINNMISIILRHLVVSYYTCKCLAIYIGWWNVSKIIYLSMNYTKIYFVCSSSSNSNKECPLSQFFVYLIK